MIHITVFVRHSNRKALQKMARQTVGSTYLTLDKKKKTAKLKNIENSHWILHQDGPLNSKRRSREGNRQQLLQAVKEKVLKYIGNVLYGNIANVFQVPQMGYFTKTKCHMNFREITQKWVGRCFILFCLWAYIKIAVRKGCYHSVKWRIL